MDTTQLRLIIDDLEDEVPVEDVPIDSIAEVLSTGDREQRRMGAYAIRLAAEQNTNAVMQYSHSVVRVLPAQDPSVASDLIRTVGLMGEHNPEILEEASGGVFDGLSADDAEERLQSAIATRTLAGIAPSIVADNIDILIDRIDDPNPRLRAIVFEILAEVTNEECRAVVEAIPRATDATSAGNRHVRTNALHFLTEVAESDPEAIVPYTADIRPGLTDPAGIARSNAAYVLAHVGKEKPEKVAPYLEDLVRLLTDSEETARGNSSFALIEVGNQLPDRLPAEQISKRLGELLDTPIVSIQENAVYLTALVVQHDRSVITNPGDVKTRIRDLQSDPVVDVSDETFDLILGALDTVDDTGRQILDNERQGNRSHGEDKMQSGKAQTEERGNTGEGSGYKQTEVFNTSTIASCPNCKIDLATFDDPMFCPNCGEDL